jgi:translocation protein SEC62
MLTLDFQSKKKKGKKSKPPTVATTSQEAAPSATTTSAEPASTPIATPVKRDLTARVEEVEE